MSLSEVITNFKNFILSDPYSISQEDQELFQSDLSEMSSEYLTQLRIVLEQLRVKLPPGVYKTYYSLINSIIGAQDGLQGRISPDILEPITQVHSLNPIRSFNTNETMEITTGTSIWALYLKRQLLDQNRINQRHIKSVISLKFLLLRMTSSLKIFAFFQIFYWKSCENRLAKGLKILEKHEKIYLKTILVRIKEYGKEKKKIWKNIGKALNLFEGKLRKVELEDVRMAFNAWKNKNFFSFSYFSISPIKKEVDCENELRVIETNSILREKKILSALTKLGLIGNKVKYLSYFNILSYTLESLHNLQSVTLINTVKTENLIETLAKYQKKSALMHLSNTFNSLKSLKTSSKHQERLLKSLQKHLKFRISTFFNTFLKAVRSSSLKSSILDLHLHNLQSKILQKYFSLITSYPTFLQKKAFEAFVHNYYNENAETVNKSWRWKLSNIETKQQNLFSHLKSQKQQSSLFLSLLKSYSKRLKIHTFNTLKHLNKKS